MRIVITGGGTGGHIYPALAVALILKDKGWDILYIGSSNSLEEKIAKEWGLKFESVNVAPLPRKLTYKLFKSAASNFKGLYQSRKIINEFNADLVFGTGGFVTGSVVLAAFLKGVPTLIHEQNVYPGLTNKLLSYLVDKIAVNFVDAKEYFSGKVNNKIVHTGNPVRDDIIKTKRKDGIKYFDFSFDKKTLLIFGGSQGSVSINKAVLGIYEYVLAKNDIQLIHITGKNNYEKQLNYINKKGINLKKYAHIKIIPYLDHMEYAYAAADLVISRAGATGIAEITVKGLASILIPYPFATGDHQMYNAKSLSKHGAAKVIAEKNLDKDILLKNFKRIIEDKKLLKKMSKKSKKLGERNAANKIVAELEDLVK